jgi:uncharacterized protein YidB (DUF937 family)
MGLLDNVLGHQSASVARMSPITMALVGVLAYRTVKGKGRLAEMLGRKPEDSAAAQQPHTDTTKSSLGGLLGGLLPGGLGDLVKQFQDAGYGEKAKSWIASGPNKPVAPVEIEQALGPEKIAWLMQQTGLSREDLVAGLSRELPTAIDKLTPQGRIPTDLEAARMA